jgi:hypothetical protein
MENFRADAQITNLGLTKILAGHTKYQVLDFGCGENAYLTKYLEERGFSVDGIDSEIRSPIKNLIKQKVTEIWPNNGCIPKDNETYDLVLAHQNFGFNETFTGLRNTQFLKCNIGESYQEEIIQRERVAKNCLLELCRVCKTSGAIVVYPEMDLLKPVFGADLKRLSLKSRTMKVPEVDKSDGEISCEGCSPGCYEYCGSILSRTIIYRAGVNKGLLKNLTE